ncbi:hypothetical protein [Rhodoferax sp.]|uniref:hypothetical protein n=1 Tax=Rhodoferax sp. TaxID=50421 RepID=UPI0027158F54|nr:hypothetical protein [Rhodoferax sp.]MDO8317962.1 hypothetical protein [Rhodoferax sp.]
MAAQRFTMLLLAACAAAQAQDAEPQLSGQVRAQWDGVHANTAGPLAAAHTLQAGIATLPVNGVMLETELRASGKGITSVLTLQQQRLDDNAINSRAWVNELFASHDAGAWQFSAGKKIVSWDVGYGYRPNDMVQQETRRTLVSSTPEGRPMLLAEHFDADTAWSLVAVNPSASMNARDAQEPALAARLYQRFGAADAYGFARLGARTGASAGAALAWVATEALELHSSVRFSKHIDSQSMDPQATPLVARNPWQPSTVPNVTQWLIGGTWTSPSQLSLLTEVWWDGSAPGDAQWNNWSQRNHQLSALAALGAPAAAVAGNLAWQAQSLGLSQNLRRSNVFVRLSWQKDPWKPSLDLLYTPADQGRVVTAALTWQGDRMQVQGGVRVVGGPAAAVLAQLPAKQLAYVALTWTF